LYVKIKNMNCNIFEITDGDFINKSDRLKNLFDAIENYSKETIPNVKPGVEELFDSNPELANQVYEALGFKEKPDVILPIGTSGSGKSTFIKSLPQENLVVIEPDAMRVEFTGDINNKSKDKEIYEEAAKRAINAIKQGKQVVFDTTNLTRDKRLPFIEAIKKEIPDANIQYKLMELNPELAKQRIKAQIARGENRANVPDSTIDRHAESYKQMLEDIKYEPISNFEITPQQKQQALQLYSQYLDTGKQDIEGFKDFVGNKKNINNFIYTLIDNFPDVFTINYDGTVLVKGDIKNPNHGYNVIKKAINNIYNKKDLFVETKINSELHTINFNFDNINVDTYAKNNPVSNVEEGNVKNYFYENKPKVVVTPEEYKDSENLEDPSIVFKSIPHVQDQVNHLVEAFKEAGISITIKYDSNLKNKSGEAIKGRVYKESEESATIYLNPVKMGEGTFIHEFSHIFIDLLGEDNPLVKQAYTSLKDTDLYNKIKEAYPELTEKQLLDETLVTAMENSGIRRQEGKTKLEIAINKIIRALKNLFQIEDEAVELLLDKLFSKRLNKNEFKGQISEESKESREIDINYVNIKDLKDKIKVVLQTQLDKLESAVNKNDTDIILIKANLNALDKVNSIDKFTEFIDYLDSISRDNDKIIKSIKGKDLDKLTEEEKNEMLYDLHKVSNRIADVFGAEENSILSKLELAIIEKTSKNEREGKKSEKLSSMEQKLSKISGKLKSQKKYYLDMGAVIQGSLLLGYVGPGIGTKLENFVENIKSGKRVIDKVAKKHKDYEETKRKYKNKEIKYEEYREALHKMTVEQLEGRKLGLETIVNELREAQTDKSAYSVYMDPMMYSSQTTLQLFTSIIKNKKYQANNDTNDVIDRLAPIYNSYKNSKGSDTDPKKFNEDILETHTYYIKDEKTGFRKAVEMLSFVQPYDITRFNTAEYEMRKNLKDKFKVPKYNTPEYEKWRGSSSSKAYYKEIAKWYRENTITLKSGIEKVREIDERLKDIQNSMRKTAPGGAEENADKYAIYKAHELELVTQRGRLYDSKNKQYKGEAVRPNSKYANSKFNSMLSIDENTGDFTAKNEAGKYYIGLITEYHKHQSYCGKRIPTKNSWDKYAYVLPSIEAEGLEKIQKDNYNVFKSTKDYFSRGFSFLSTDDSFGAVINANKEQRNKIVPIYFVDPTDAKFVSHDVASTIVLFAGMANQFRRKSEIVGSVMIMRDLLQEREILDTNENGVPFINSVANRLGIKRYHRKKGESNNFKHLVEFIDSEFFGEKELRSQINIAGRSISANKLTNKLITHSALNTLALNGLQAANQFLIDELRLGQEAIVGQYFNGKNMTWAKGEYTSAILSGQTITDIGKFKKESKLANFILSYDLLGNALSEPGRNRTGSTFIKSISLDNLFFLQHMAEHETAVTRGLAIADSYRGKLKDKDGKVIKNEKGEDANLYDLYIQDEKTGKWGLDPRVANFKDINFINMVSGLYKKTNQIKTSIDDPMFNRRWYGKALILYRRYFQPGLRARWGYKWDDFHLDTETDTITEGMYFTFLRYVKESMSKGNRFSFISTYKLLDSEEKANVKRTFVEASFMLSMTVIGSMLMAAMDDDDEDDYVNAFFAYQALRISSELSQFYRPEEFYRFVSSPTALTKPMLNATKLVGQIFEFAAYKVGISDGEDVFYKRTSGEFRKGDLKLVKTFNDLAPIIRGIEKTKNPEDALKFFIAPPGVN